MFKPMLKDLLLTYGPSGREETIAACIERYAAPYCDSVSRDPMGNLICLRRGTSGKRIMLSAHMDQIGLAVTDADDNGFLRVTRVGSVNPLIAVGRHVVFQNGVSGVIGWETRHKKFSELDFADLFIDIGAEDRESALASVDIGDMCVFSPDFNDMGDRISCGALDNRISCAILIEVLRRAQTDHDIYAVFTTQEEVGCRGAAPAAYGIEPDLCINLDTTLSGDTPEGYRLNMVLGGGVCIKAMDASCIVPPYIRRFLQDTAEQNGITYQLEVLHAGGTDTGVIQRVRDGIPSGCISIPTRYIHTPVETVALSDAENAIRLCCAVLGEEELPAPADSRRA